jgi:EAL domain-containing protein (putative c-di-GMP-specific phosphodiesterase class I)
MNAATKALRLPIQLTREHIEQFTREQDGQVSGRFGNINLGSAFQPIFSLAHRRAVGFEALLRPQAADGSPLSPLAVFDLAQDEAEGVFLDRLCRVVHARNFMAQADNVSWLFLNVDPMVTVYGKQHGAFFTEMLDRYQISPHRVVVEILEGHIRDESLLVDAAEYYKELGCLVAIDDFGAGHSNFERIWRVQPHIVKLDRSIITQAAANPTVRRIVPNLVNLVHEAGSMVLMEGIETEQEAMIALDSDMDFVQGFYFAKPAGKLPPITQGRVLLDELCAKFKLANKKITSRNKDELHAYLDAFQVFAKQFKAGTDAMDACQALLELPRAERCYLLDNNGRQLGDSFASPRSSSLFDPRFQPLNDSSDAIWARRHYFWRAANRPGEVQASRPYLSIAGGNMCVTLSVAVFCQKELVVLCADLKWND